MMGAMFVLSVRTGRELQAFEMIKHNLRNLGETARNLIHKVHLNDTSYQVVNGETKEVDLNGEVTESDRENQRKIDSLNTSINNRRLQLQAIEKYTDKEHMEAKARIRSEMNELQRKVTKLRKGRKRVKSIFSGYMIVELSQYSEYLPDYLWHFFKNIPLVIDVLDRYPIPQHEVEQFMTVVEEEVEPEVELVFDEEKEYEEMRSEAKELVHEINTQEVSEERKDEVLEKIDDLFFSVVEKVQQLIDDKPKNNLLNKIHAFIKRKRRVLSVPLSLLESLYTRSELLDLGRLLNGRDFINRLRKLLTSNQLDTVVV